MSPAGGHIRLTRGVFSIEDQQLTLPDPIALDTSFVVEALLATQPLHGACDAFLKRISVVTSELLRIELAETAFAIAMKERWGRRWRAHRTDGRSRRRAARLLHDTISRYDALLAPVDHFPVPLGDITATAIAIMTDYGIESYDAAHAATAISAGAETIVTLDTGFALLPSTQLTMYTDHSRLASCRAKRPHRQTSPAPS
jgi:predicted nucleic acid-binding protein